MKTLRVGFVIVMNLLIASSCADKDSTSIIIGTWELTEVVRYDAIGEIMPPSFYDTIQHERRSYFKDTLQILHFDTINNFYFLLVEHYTLNDSLNVTPVRVLDRQGNSYSWNPVDSFFVGYHYVKAYPFVSSVDFDTDGRLVETRQFPKQTIVLTYERSSQMPNDLMDELIEFAKHSSTKLNLLLDAVNAIYMNRVDIR